jgi:hypothetical protein
MLLERLFDTPDNYICIFQIVKIVLYVCNFFFSLGNFAFVSNLAGMNICAATFGGRRVAASPPLSLTPKPVPPPPTRNQNLTVRAPTVSMFFP